MTPRYAPPCPHRCCVDDEPHEHTEGPTVCPDCIGLADLHDLAAKALRIGGQRYPRINQTGVEEKT